MSCGDAGAGRGTAAVIIVVVRQLKSATAVETSEPISSSLDSVVA